MDTGSLTARLACVIAALAGCALALPAAAFAEFGVQHRFETVPPAGTHPSTAPEDLEADRDGSVYVLYGSAIQKYDPSGSLVAMWDRRGGPGVSDIAVDGLGHVYVAFPHGYKVEKLTTVGDVVATWRDFRLPHELDTDAAGNVYVQEEPESIRGVVRPASARLHKVSPAGELLAVRRLPHHHMAVAPGGRLFQHVFPASVFMLDPSDLVRGGPRRTRAIRLAPGEKADDHRAYIGACCGVAALKGQIWVARSAIRLIESYDMDGGLERACPTSELFRDITAGRDGRLYVLDDRSVIRYGESATPCDTRRPAVTSLWLRWRTVDLRSRSRLSVHGIFFATSEQGTAEITFTRLVEGRRVVEARVGDILASVTGANRVPKRFWRGKLPAGRYLIAVVVTDRAGLRSKPRVVRARVIR